MAIDKYLGQTVDIIYVDRNRRFTQRRIVIHAVRDGKVRAYDCGKRAFRVFHVHNIMAYRPAGRAAG